ncbi:MAG TPA: hypothetical protein VK698_27030 [Kofleriaceae bacterium]|nr:hypothetical protein [Kofleriaceae bacterium]
MFEYLARDRRRLRRGTRAFAREVSIGEACVFVDHGFQWDGANNVWLTRARASFVMQAGPSFDMRPRTLWNRLIGAAARTATIDPYFDAFFSVRTPSPDHTWDALTTRARTLMAHWFEDARVVSDGRMVTLWREAEFGREADGDAAAELVSEIVSLSSSALDAYRRLPAATYSSASGPWYARRPPSIEMVAPVPVRIEPSVLHGRPVTSVSAACGRVTEPFAMNLLGVGSVVGSSYRAPVPRGLIRAARELGAALLRCDGQRVIVCWDSLETDRNRLTSAASLLASFAAGPGGGMYR